MEPQDGRPYWEREQGVAPIKSDFVLWDKLKPGRGGRGPRDQDDDDAAEGNTKSAPRDDGPPPKKARSEGGPADDEAGPDEPANGGGLSKRQQKKRGANKARQFAKTSDEIKLCPTAASGEECKRVKPAEAAAAAEGEEGKGKGKGKGRRGWDDGCRFSHDVEAYLASKPADILSHLDTDFASLPSTDFTFATPTDPADTDKPIPVPRPTTVPRCPLLVATGQCPFGYRCRFLSTHLDPPSALSTDPTRRESYLSSLTPTDSRNGRRLEWTDRGETNNLGLQPLRSLRKRKYAWTGSKVYMDSIGQPMDQREGHKKGKRWRDGEQKADKDEEAKDDDEEDVEGREKPALNGNAQPAAGGEAAVNGHAQAHAKSLDVDLARPRPSERPRLQHWRATGQNLYLAPLTTVGNLPFRRLASSLGADITCGEMALGQDLMSGSGSEWSLVRRYKDEKCFGAQIAGSRAQVLVPTAETLSKECYLDFVDVNCGCPIDLVFQKGAGSALLDHANKLGRSVIGMNRVLGPQGVPVTIKLRTGIAESKPTAHKLFARAQGEWGVSAVTLHGRSRQQRYSKRADWTYISRCVDVARTVAENLGEDPIPIFGNGDCFDYRDYWESVENSKADGVMLARGALIKPWLFTEIKERRDWDISARERLDLYRQLASYGLEHWGSDTHGVNMTRRFLCEAISFQYRYVPVGLLERLPARINERPLPFKGRDELETLLASGDSQDWVRISNLFLGKPPDEWSFTPKHRSNASGPATEENG